MIYTRWVLSLTCCVRSDSQEDYDAGCFDMMLLLIPILIGSICTL